VAAAGATVRVVLPARALGNRRSLAGARVLVSTWDYDGGFRALSPEGGPFVFGGGAPGVDAKVMDESAVIVVP
jgi:hypothetical protein